MGSFRIAPPVLKICVCVAAWLALPAAARAQDAAPPHIALVDGRASLEREGHTQPVAAGLPLLEGDRLQTAAGRVEVLFPDGSALDVDEYSSVDLQSPTLLRLTTGRLLLTVAGADDPASALRYQIDTPVASARTDGPGDYRVALFSDAAGLEAELAVLRGAAALMTERGSTSLRAGERALAHDQNAPTPPQTFNSARFDAFDRWSEAQRTARLGTAASAQHLPRDLRMHSGTFDRHGAWQHEAPYGYVWYPAVAPGWRPYYDGYWSSLRPYGWTWIGHNAWAWPTHHYGRWGFGRDRWFWIPDRRWAPAWVSWAASPGYVSWCPLGFDGRPVFGLSVGGGYSDRWVFVPRHRLGDHVNRYAVAPRHLPRSTPFIVQAAAPVTPSRAIRRNVTVAPAASTGVAIPRDSTRALAVPRGARGSTQSPTDMLRGEPDARQRRPTIDAQSSIGSPTDRPAAVRRAPAGELRAPGPTLYAPPTSPERPFRQPLPDVPRAYRRVPDAARPAAVPPSGSRPSQDAPAVIDHRRDPRVIRPIEPPPAAERSPRSSAPSAAMPRRGPPLTSSSSAAPPAPSAEPSVPSRMRPMAVPRRTAPATAAPADAGGGDRQPPDSGGRRAPASRRPS